MSFYLSQVDFELTYISLRITIILEYKDEMKEYGAINFLW